MMLFEEIFPAHTDNNDSSCNRHFCSENDRLFDDIFSQTHDSPSAENFTDQGSTRFPFEGYCDYAFPVVISDD